MIGGKMAKKSISDLERYRDLLKIKVDLTKTRMKERVLVVEGEDFDFLSECELLEVLLNKIDLLEYEISVALFSNSITVDGEEVSIKQAQDNFYAIKDRLKFFEELKGSVLPVREKMIHGHAMNIYVLKISLDQLDYVVEGLYEDIYSLGEKVQKAKDSIKVDVDMKDFVIEDLVVVSADEVSQT
jgi:hypothetical protein